MEEKAAEGNVAYFSEFSTEELEKRLKHKDEDDRTLVHICAAAGESFYFFTFFLSSVERWGGGVESKQLNSFFLAMNFDLISSRHGHYSDDTTPDDCPPPQVKLSSSSSFSRTPRVGHW